MLPGIINIHSILPGKQLPKEKSFPAPERGREAFAALGPDSGKQNSSAFPIGLHGCII